MNKALILQAEGNTVAYQPSTSHYIKEWFNIGTTKSGTFKLSYTGIVGGESGRHGD